MKMTTEDDQGEGGHSAAFTRLGKNHLVVNRWIIPYNPFLLKHFQCHINAEIALTIKSIKYVVSYIQKGSDQAVFVCAEYCRWQKRLNWNVPSCSDNMSEWSHVLYISIFNALSLFTYPASVGPPRKWATSLFQPWQCCKCIWHDTHHLDGFFQSLVCNNAFARGLLYWEVPQYYTFTKGKWCWCLRGKPHPLCDGIFCTPTLGWIYSVSPRQTDCFFLWLLLHHVRVPSSFADLKTVDGMEWSGPPTEKTVYNWDSLEMMPTGWNAWMGQASPKNQKPCAPFLQLFWFMTIQQNPSLLWGTHKINLSEDLLRINNLETITNAIQLLSLQQLQELVTKMGGHLLTVYGLLK